MATYEQWLQSCLQCGIQAISIDTAARLMAILYEYGNNEAFVYNQKIIADKDYIQKRFGVHDGGIADPSFSSLLKRYVKELQEYYEARENADSQLDRIPEWVPKLLEKRYDIKILV